MKEITESMLDELRNIVMQQLSPKRFYHTVAVERMIERLCALFCPEETMRMRAAALLHDLTKELEPSEQLALCEKHGIPVSESDRLSPKTFHARTAAAEIGIRFPELAHPTVVQAVRWHTTGRGGMTLTEKLLYLADYIDDSRTFGACVMLRRYFFGAEPERMDAEGRMRLLNDTLLLSYDFTLRDLLEDRKPIDENSLAARNSLLLEVMR